MTVVAVRATAVNPHRQGYRQTLIVTNVATRGCAQPFIPAASSLKANGRVERGSGGAMERCGSGDRRQPSHAVPVAAIGDNRHEAGFFQVAFQLKK